MKEFAEYLAIFFCREASSVVQSQLGRLGEHRKLQPRPGIAIWIALVPQKSGWSAKPRGTGVH